MTPLLLLSSSYAHAIFIFEFVQTTEAKALRLDSVMYDIQYMTEKMTKHNGNSANETWSRVPLGEPQYRMTCLVTNWNRSFPGDATTTGPLFVVTICCCAVGSWDFAVCSTEKTNSSKMQLFQFFFNWSCYLYFIVYIIVLYNIIKRKMFTNNRYQQIIKKDDLYVDRKIVCWYLY